MRGQPSSFIDYQQQSRYKNYQSAYDEKNLRRELKQKYPQYSAAQIQQMVRKRFDML
jgi:hypothetical protein